MYKNVRDPFDGVLPLARVDSKGCHGRICTGSLQKEVELTYSGNQLLLRFDASVGHLHHEHQSEGAGGNGTGVDAGKGQCKDYPDWKDTYQWNCAMYALTEPCGGPDPWDSTWSPIESYKSKDGYSALDACCKCGGGYSGDQTPPPTEPKSEYESWWDYYYSDWYNYYDNNDEYNNWFPNAPETPKQKAKPKKKVSWPTFRAYQSVGRPPSALAMASASGTGMI